MYQAEPHGFNAPAFFNFAEDVLDYWAQIRPDALALWWVSAQTGSEIRLTFRQLSEMSGRVASGLRNCGISRGERVLLMLPRVPQWWTAMLGLIRLGAVPVPATLLLTRRDVEYRLSTAAVQAAITNEAGISKVDGFTGTRIGVQTDGKKGGGTWPSGWLDFETEVNKAGHFQAERTASSDPGILYFTSATTGEPKMVLHTQASYGLGHQVTGKYWLDCRPDEVHWNISDLGWGKAAWSSFFGPWHMGACVFALDVAGKFDAALTLDVLSRFPISTWCAPPTALRLLVRQDLSKWRFPTLRHCVTAGEPLNPEVLNLWRGATGLTLYEGYGQTETVALVANSRRLAQPVEPGSMGKSLPGAEVAILDENLRELPAGEEGEICIRVKPQRPLGLFQEYWLNPEETGRKFQGDWYLTGDRALRDEGGYFWFVGRKDDVIKSSGYRIGPFEVESALMEHPAVMDVAVIGKPDALRGQIVKACVVVRDGVETTDQLKTELQSHCKKLIAAYKYPREIEFVPGLPKTTSGKTRHVELRHAATRYGAST